MKKPVSSNQLSRLVLAIAIVAVFATAMQLVTQNIRNQVTDAQEQAMTKTKKVAEDDLQKRIEYLAVMIGGYPPQFESEEQETQVRQEWSATVEQGERLLALAKDPAEQVQLHYQLGQLYRLGHNLDNEGSWEKAEEHFLAALNLDSHHIDSKGGLATLYVNSNIELAPAAEKLYLSALEDAKTDEQKIDIYRGLVFARVYQFRIKDALAAADEGLKIDPKDEQLLLMKSIYEKRLQDGK